MEKIFLNNSRKEAAQHIIDKYNNCKGECSVVFNISDNSLSFVEQLMTVEENSKNLTLFSGGGELLPKKKRDLEELDAILYVYAGISLLEGGAF